MALGRVHYVTGKGGVGKSTVAAALALGLTARGERVLAIELSPPAGLSRLLGVRPSEPGEQSRVRDELWLSYFDGEAALAEYLRRRMRLGPLLPRIVEHPLYRAFVGGAPGLRELMATGKVRDELRRTEGIHRRWDAIVIDAGASGHALDHLRMPGAAARTFGKGLVHREARRNEELLQDPDHTAVWVVALPEEMPLQEATELAGRLEELRLPLRALVVNRCRALPPPGIDDALEALRAVPPLSPGEERVREGVEAAVRRERGWIRIQEQGIAALEERTGREALRLPELEGLDLGRAELEQLAAGLLEDAT